jgi:hypothetical protein
MIRTTLILLCWLAAASSLGEERDKAKGVRAWDRALLLFNSSQEGRQGSSLSLMDHLSRLLLYRSPRTTAARTPSSARFSRRYARQPPRHPSRHSSYTGHLLPPWLLSPLLDTPPRHTFDTLSISSLGERMASPGSLAFAFLILEAIPGPLANLELPRHPPQLSPSHSPSEQTGLGIQQGHRASSRF